MEYGYRAVRASSSRVCCVAVSSPLDRVRPDLDDRVPRVNMCVQGGELVWAIHRHAERPDPGIIFYDRFKTGYIRVHSVQAAEGRRTERAKTGWRTTPQLCS